MFWLCSIRLSRNRQRMFYQLFQWRWYQSGFHCHPDHDCTLYCDSRNATDSCSGTILNATYSQNTRITVHCLNYRSCQHLVVDTSFSVNTSLSMSVRMDPPFVPLLNAEGHLTDIPKYTAKHAAVYLPDSGMATIECEGHSVCHSMAIYGNTTSLNGVSALNLTVSGFHSFKSSYLSIPTRSDVRIWCGLQNQKDALTNSGVHVIGGPCNGAVFDGRDSGMDSTMTIECHGDSACTAKIEESIPSALGEGFSAFDSPREHTRDALNLGMLSFRSLRYQIIDYQQCRRYFIECEGRW